MKLVQASKYHKCKHGHDIWSGDYYYPQRRKQCLCFNCGFKPKGDIFIRRGIDKLND